VNWQGRQDIEVGVDRRTLVSTGPRYYRPAVVGVPSVDSADVGRTGLEPEAHLHLPRRDAGGCRLRTQNGRSALGKIRR